MAIGFTSGQEVTADDLNALVPTYLPKASDQSFNSTSYADVTTFAALPFSAGQRWQIEAHFVFAGNETSDIRFRWQSTGGVTFVSRLIRNPSTVNAAYASNEGPTGGQSRTLTADVSGAVDSSTTTHTWWQETIILETTTSGTLSLQSCNVSASGAVVLYGVGGTGGPSYLVMRRLS